MRLAFLPGIFLIASTAAAQCCPTANLSCQTGFASGNTNVFAMIMPKCSSASVIFGLTLRTQSMPSGKQTVKFHIHLADAANKPVIPPAKSGTIIVDTAYANYSGKLSAPMIVPANTQYFVSFENAGMRHPICRVGGTLSTQYWWHPPTSTTWNGTFSQFWTYRVDTAACPPTAAYQTYGTACKGSNGTPTLTNTGLPKLGASFTVNLSNARAAAPSLVTLGFSDTAWGAIPLPLKLGPFGATGCTLLTSGEIMFGIVTSTTGTGSFKITIPNASTFGGLVLFNQFIITDPTVNALKLVLSNAGKMTIGL